MSVRLLTHLHLEFLSLKGGCTGSSESTLIKMSNCWKSHVMAHLWLYIFQFTPHLEEDFRRVAVVAAFLEAVRNGEASSINPTFLDSLDLLESQLYPFLCQLYNAMFDRSVTDLPRVTRNIIMFTDRNMGSAAERYSRDYRILKDTVELFQAINNGFMIFLNDHNS